MAFVTICLRLHQPYCLNQYSPADVERNHCYFSAEACSRRIDALANKCLLPTNNLLLHLINKYDGKFKVSLSISGITLEMLNRHRPDMIVLLKKMADTGCVEFLGETCNNSLSWLYSKKEFERQILKHKNIITHYFGMEPKVFRNTELIHNNDLAKFISDLGFKGMICEGTDNILSGRSRNRVYTPPGNGAFGLLLRNFRMSDDIAFRLGEENWPEHPLTAEKFASWIHRHNEDTECINLMPDYETFGIHKTKQTGIFDFLRKLPQEVLADENWSFATPTEVLNKYSPADVYDVKQTTSWSSNGEERGVRCENVMQNNMLRKIYSMEQMIRMHNDEKLFSTWERLQSSDYFRYMSNNERNADDMYRCTNPFNSPEEAYRNYLNIITDFELQLIKKSLAAYKKTNYTHNYSTLY